MHEHTRLRIVVALCVLVVAAACRSAPAPAAQNPSPMVDHTRAHKRIAERDSARGSRYVIDGVLPGPVRVFVPEQAARGPARLLIHFHGAAFVGEHAVAESARPYVVANVHLGAGSGVYERPFLDRSAFDRLVDAVLRATSRDAFDGIVLSGFSAGYGAIRAILRDTVNESIEGVLLLDGLHTGYLPDGLVLHEGGRLDTSLLEPFVRFARRAAANRARMLITHSEIFPGTFASTTETADHLIAALGLARTPVLEWGPVGMQQLSLARTGSFAILGFAGNTAPDHVDHYHGLPFFLRAYDGLEGGRMP